MLYRQKQLQICHLLKLLGMNNIKNIANLISLALTDLKRNKIRAFLTTLGLLIGISSVVLLTSLGLGLKKFIEDQFKSLGSNLIIVMPGKTFSEGKYRMSSAAQMVPVFDNKDVIAIKKIDLTETVAPSFVKFLEYKGERDTKIYETVISTGDIFAVLNGEAESGRLFTQSDISKRSKVAVLGAGPAEKLYGSPQNALNKKVKINSQSYKIVGILKSKGGGGFGIPSIDDHVYLPNNSASVFNPDKKFLAIYAKPKKQEELGLYKNLINETLLKRYHQDDFTVLDQKELFDTFSSVFTVVNGVILAIAAISLIVGGIGIMNIMFVSVVQRIKEIGIRRAYGAREKDILILFLSETIILSLIGGFLGLFISYTAVLFIRPFFPAYIDLNSVILALTVSIGIGFLSGILPAMKAAKLTPVEAIRKE